MFTCCTTQGANPSHRPVRECALSPRECWALGMDTLLLKGTQSSETAMN